MRNHLWWPNDPRGEGIGECEGGVIDRGRDARKGRSVVRGNGRGAGGGEEGIKNEGPRSEYKEDRSRRLWDESC